MNNRMSILLFSLAAMIFVASCCPEIRQQETTTEKRLIEVRNDTVFVSRLIPRTEITDESATFITKPSVETIDTIIRAEGTLRDYHISYKRRTKPYKVVSGDSVKTILQPEYIDILFTPVKADSLFNEVTTSNTEFYRGRPWYEIPLYVITAIAAFVIGLFIGRRL